MCHDWGAHPPILPISGAAIEAEDIVLTAQDGNRFAAYIARPAQSNGAQVLILPDVRGLHPFYKELAQRFAETGTRALAIDYFGRTAGISPRDETFEYHPHAEKIELPAVLQDVAAAFTYLRSESKTEQATFLVGFCRGGALALQVGAENFPLAGIVAFYPGLSRPIPGSRGSTLEQASKIRCPVLTLFGGADPSIPASDRQKLDEQLDRAGVEHEIVAYPGVPHSFFDRRYAEFAEASADAWKRTLEFIAKHAKKK